LNILTLPVVIFYSSFSIVGFRPVELRRRFVEYDEVPEAVLAFMEAAANKH